MDAALFSRPCPEWTPRRPAMTIDARDALGEIVMSPNATPAARFAAAEAMDFGHGYAPLEDWWRQHARRWADLYEGGAS